MKPINDAYMCFSCGIVNLEWTSVCPECRYETKPGQTHTIEEAHPGEAIAFEMSQQKISAYQSSSSSLSGFGSGSHHSLSELERLPDDAYSSEFRTAIVVTRGNRVSPGIRSGAEFLQQGEEPSTIEEVRTMFVGEEEFYPSQEANFFPPSSPCYQAIDSPGSMSIDIDELSFASEVDSPVISRYEVSEPEEK